MFVFAEKTTSKKHMLTDQCKALLTIETYWKNQKPKPKLTETRKNFQNVWI